MATLSEIRQAIATTVKPTGLMAYANVEDVVQVPAMVVMPARDTADFNGAFGRGLDTWRFDLFILVARSTSDLAQQELDQYLTGGGPKSLRQVFYENGNLGLDDVSDVHPEGVKEYGGKFQTARIDHVGAILKVTVRTSGK